LSESVYELLKNRMVPKCPVCGFLGMTQKTWSRICGFMGIWHCTGTEGVKIRYCLLFSGQNI